jgi:hypothetical protein
LVWGELESMHLNSGIFVVRKHGSSFDWLRIGLDDIANAPIFLQIAHSISPIRPK